ncbi:MAG: chemotaxis protein [Bradyrhizobiaceae bacterium]|nr:MAG: chemotaxis protein [Bradyrhizobiaceae bacterium]
MNEAWIRDDKGKIVVFPLMGYETMVVENRALALRLPFMVQGDKPDMPSGNIQLIISNAKDAREFARDILAAAERIENAKA